MLAALDPSLLNELREQMAAIADDPLPKLRPSRSYDEPPATLVYEYASEVITNLELRVFFETVRVSHRVLTITGVLHRGHDAPK